MFPPEILALQEEILEHPPLMEQLYKQGPTAPIEDKMGTVCAYCGIILDGIYDEKDILKLAEKCTKELYEARKSFIHDILNPTPTLKH